MSEAGLLQDVRRAGIEAGSGDSVVEKRHRGLSREPACDHRRILDQAIKNNDQESEGEKAARSAVEREVGPRSPGQRALESTRSQR